MYCPLNDMSLLNRRIHVRGMSLSSSLLSHNEFFVRIISLIPSELYGLKQDENEDDEDDEDENKDDVDKNDINSKYFKHRKQPLSVDEKKLLSKQAKKEKFKALSAAQIVQVAERETDDAESHNGDNEEIPTEMPTKHALDSLRERLQVLNTYMH